MTHCISYEFHETKKKYLKFGGALFFFRIFSSSQINNNRLIKTVMFTMQQLLLS